MGTLKSVGESICELCNVRSYLLALILCVVLALKFNLSNTHWHIFYASVLMTWQKSEKDLLCYKYTT